MLESEADLVETFQQAGAAKVVEFKCLDKTEVIFYGLIQQRHVQFVATALFGSIQQSVHMALCELYQNNAVVSGIGVEDVCKARSDDYAETVVQQRPSSMFSRRSAAEVLPRQENRCAGILRLIQYEARLRASIVCIAPVVEQKLAVAGACDAFQKLLGDDLIGINVAA